MLTKLRARLFGDFSPERRLFLLSALAGGALSAARIVSAQTIPVMFWTASANSTGSGAIGGSPIADGPIGGAP